MTALNHVVVVGAGIGGLAAAGAIAGLVQRVTVLDRDPQLATSNARRGTPQDHHLHNLLGRGQQEIERALPGVLQGLRDAGCGDASVADQTHVFELGHRMPERPVGLRLMSATRPLIEAAARSALQRHTNVEILPGVTGSGLDIDDRGRVAGMRGHIGGSNLNWPCQLVIDASGASTASRAWLRDIGRQAPAELTQRHGRWYSTSVVNRTPDQVGDPSFWLTFTTTGTRTGLLSPLDERHWWVSVTGGPADVAPDSFDTFLNYTAHLDDDRIFEQLNQSAHGSRPRRFRRESARWRRFDELPDPVSGLLPLGDALATLDPLYGQGMSVASWQATILADVLERWDGTDIDSLTRAYLDRASDAANAAWSLGDLVDAAPAGREPEAMQSLPDRIQTDHAVHHCYVHLWHLLRSVTDLNQQLEQPDADLAGVA